MLRASRDNPTVVAGEPGERPHRRPQHDGLAPADRHQQDETVSKINTTTLVK